VTIFIVIFIEIFSFDFNHTLISHFIVILKFLVFIPRPSEFINRKVKTFFFQIVSSRLSHYRMLLMTHFIDKMDFHDRLKVRAPKFR